MYEKALIVLMSITAGAFLSAFFATFREWFLQHLKTRKEAEYLAIQVACSLDSFVYGSIDVAYDDGTCRGQYGLDGEASMQTKTPDFEPAELEVEWKSLPAKLMYEVLQFPNEVNRANRIIDSAFDMADPPEHSGGFEERQYQYAKLGLEAIELSAKLRERGGLPELEIPKHWNPSELLERIISETDKRRAAREHAQMKMHETFNSTTAGA